MQEMVAEVDASTPPENELADSLVGILVLVGPIFAAVAVARCVLTSAAGTLFDAAVQRVDLPDVASAIAAQGGALEEESWAHLAGVGVRTPRPRTAQMAGLGEEINTVVVTLVSVWDQPKRLALEQDPGGSTIGTPNARPQLRFALINAAARSERPSACGQG